MPDFKTISVYDEQAKVYKELVAQLPEDPILLEFARQFTEGSLILDLGCGPAISAATMRAVGLNVDPVDASSKMVTLANETFNVNARQATFNDISKRPIYNGVWANFSLLHAKREDFPKILKSIQRALIPGGYFHIGMKTGTGSKRDKLGRFYTYYTEAELHAYLSDTGFTITKTQFGKDRGLSHEIEPWIAISSQRL